MLETLLLVARALALTCRGHHELVLENLALRQQLHALKRTVRPPQLRARDRLFWLVLAETWRNWRTALVFVQPDTVVRWHREWLRLRGLLHRPATFSPVNSPRTPLTASSAVP